jgi:hypothetical protein
MELFLNLCWLALVLPAYLLWRRRVSSARPAGSSVVVLGALFCALILLFPVISASDDLHATTPAIEESKRSFRNGAPRACSVQIAHASPCMDTVSASFRVGFEQLGWVQLFSTHSPQTAFACAAAGRSPPLAA